METSVTEPDSRLILSVGIALLAIAPLWPLPIDFWDGRVLDYAFANHDFRGLKPWLFGSRWYLAYYLDLAINTVSDFTTVSYRFWITAVASLAIVGVAVEVFYYAERTLRLTPRYTLLAAWLALLFPAWHTLAASVMLIFIICVWLVSLGYRLTLHSHIMTRCTGVVVVLLSFQLNSNCSFIIGLCLAECIFDFLHSGTIRRATWLRGVLLSVWALVTLLAIKLWLPPYGLYADYNHIALPHSLHDCLPFILRTIDFLAWPMIFLMVPVIGYLAVWLYNRKLADIASLPRALHAECGTALALACLTAAATLPYIAVLKSSHIYDYNDWSQRHAYLLCIPLSLMLAWMSQIATASLKDAKGTVLIPLLALLSFAVPLYIGYSHKVERASFELDVIEALKTKVAPPDGIVNIHYPDMADMTLRDYEASWLLWRAYHLRKWVAGFGHRLPVGHMEIPPLTQQVLAAKNPAVNLVYLLPDSTKIVCDTDIFLSGQRLATATAWKWLFGLSPLPAFSISSETVQCVK